MANIEVKLRRGTDTEHSSFTGAEGEVTVDTTNDTLRVHDGSTAGGIRLAKLSEVSGGTGTVTEVDAGTGLETNPVSGIVGTGTIGISDGGVGTTQLANDAVTFAKMQDINTAKVIGRTTAGSGDPEEVSILDEDTMTSNSATALATQQSIKAYVDSQVISKYTAAWATSHGSVTVANGSTHTITHNLGTTDVIVQVFVNTSASDTNGQQVSTSSFSPTAYGFITTNFSTNSVTIQLSNGGYYDLDGTGSASVVSYASKYIKVVVIG